MIIFDFLLRSNVNCSHLFDNKFTKLFLKMGHILQTKMNMVAPVLVEDNDRILTVGLSKETRMT